MLSAADVEYSDTHWVPRDRIRIFSNPLQYLTLTSTYPSANRFPVLSNPESVTCNMQCEHPVVFGLLSPGDERKPVNIAMSVVLSSMLHTTAEFNAFQMVVDSRKFDMNEPLIFYFKETFSGYFRFRFSALVYRFSGYLKVDPAGLALLVDNGTDVDDPNSFLLLKTLVRSCSRNL